MSRAPSLPISSVSRVIEAARALFASGEIAITMPGCMEDTSSVVAVRPPDRIEDIVRNIDDSMLSCELSIEAAQFVDNLPPAGPDEFLQYTPALRR